MPRFFPDSNGPLTGDDRGHFLTMPHPSSHLIGPIKACVKNVRLILSEIFCELSGGRDFRDFNAERADAVADYAIFLHVSDTGFIRGRRFGQNLIKKIFCAASPKACNQMNNFSRSHLVVLNRTTAQTASVKPLGGLPGHSVLFRPD